MKLACQDHLVPGESMKEKFEQLEEWGFDGIEISGPSLPDRLDEIKNAAKNSKIKPGSVCGGYRGWLIAENLEDQRHAVEDIKKLLEYTAEIGATGLIAPTIFGTSDFLPFPERGRTVEEDREILIESLIEIGEHAEKVGSLLLLEPLNRYETHLINTLDEGVAILEEVNSEGVKLMADFFHMQIEEKNIADSIKKNGDYIHHAHLADSNRFLPGKGHTDFKSGFSALKEVGFDKYMAIECRIAGEANRGLPAAAKYLRKNM